MNIQGLWCKVPITDDADWLMLPYHSRGLYLSLWREAGKEWTKDKSTGGALHLGRHGLRGISALVATPADWPAIEQDLKPLIDGRYVAFDAATNTLTLPDFVEAQKAYAQNAEAAKKRLQRSKAEDDANGQGHVPDPSTSGEDTKGTCPHDHHHKDSESGHVPQDKEIDLRSKSKNSPPYNPPKGGSDTQPGLPLVGQSTKPATERKPSKRDVLTQTAIPILAYLSDARRSINPNCPRMQPTEASLKHIVARLAAGETPDRLRHVVDVWAALVRSDKRQFEFFNAVSPFRADNIAQYTEMSLEDAARPSMGNSSSGPGIHPAAKALLQSIVDERREAHHAGE